MKQNIYVTTPIYYVNDKPHIGHAYTSIACDVLARFARLDGKYVKFLTGTDEHGQKVEKSAAAAGVEPQDFTDMVSESFRELTGLINLSNDDFIRTTEPRHIKAAQALWEKLLNNGDIYLGSYSGWYSVRDEAFYAESELVGGIAPTGAPVEWVEEPSYFFRLSNYTEKLLDFYEQNPDFIAPESRRNEVISFVKGGLHDLSISRTTFNWGVKVPNEPAHVMYVWLDALTNYLTALGFPEEGAGFNDFWKNGETIHVVGKDILRFHAVYWPAFLMSANLPLPNRIYAHGWWTNEGQKISKSLGNVINPLQLIETYGLDPVRYFLLREVPFGNDGNFSRLQLVQRINSELANNIGNLTQRTLSLVHKNCASKVPAISENANDLELIATFYQKSEMMRTLIYQLKFSHALEIITDIARQLNEYIDINAPWSLKKTNTNRMNEVLFTLLEGIRVLGIYLQPFIPDSARKIFHQLGLGEELQGFDRLNSVNQLVAQTVLPDNYAIFPRFDMVDE
jgi:methionyl-tRNA synthetase